MHEILLFPISTQEFDMKESRKLKHRMMNATCKFWKGIRAVNI